MLRSMWAFFSEWEEPRWKGLKVLLLVVGGLVFGLIATSLAYAVLFGLAAAIQFLLGN